MTTLELMMSHPRELNLAATWLVSGLITTESELIALTLKYVHLSGVETNEETDKTSDSPMLECKTRAGARD